MIISAPVDPGPEAQLGELDVTGHLLAHVTLIVGDEVSMISLLFTGDPPPAILYKSNCSK